MLKLMKILPSRPNLIHLNIPINRRTSLERSFLANKNTMKGENYDETLMFTEVSQLVILNHFCISEICPLTQLQDLSKFHWPVKMETQENDKKFD